VLWEILKGKQNERVELKAFEIRKQLQNINISPAEH
jgi:hypothetical protein